MTSAPSATVTAYINHTQYKTEITSRQHSIIADEPADLNGTDTGLTPNELLLASLSSYTAITLQMYINRKMWAVNEITVKLELFTTDAGTIIKSKVNVKGNLNPDQKKRIEHIANACPVHKILTGKIIIETNVV